MPGGFRIISCLFKIELSPGEGYPNRNLKKNKFPKQEVGVALSVSVFKNLSKGAQSRHGSGWNDGGTGAAMRRFDSVSQFDLWRTAVPLAGLFELPGVFKLRMDEDPSSSTPQEDVKALSAETWMAVHEAALLYAKKEGFAVE